MTSEFEDRPQDPSGQPGSAPDVEQLVGQVRDEMLAAIDRFQQTTAIGAETLKGDLAMVFDRLKELANDLLTEKNKIERAKPDKIEIPGMEEAPPVAAGETPQAGDPPSETPPAPMGQIPEAVQGHVGEQPAAMPAEFAQPVESVAPMQAPIEPVQSVAPVEAVAPAPFPTQPAPLAPEPVVVQTHQVAEVHQSPWEQVVFGQDLAHFESLAPERAALIAGLVAGEGGAMTLAGQLLIFRAAPPERLPGLLKDVGEAFYRWRPGAGDGPDPMRDALIAWLRTKCEAVGVPNTIEPVYPGDRYDSKRHSAKQQGVEVVAVQGWIVLRDNGKVYTKASVTVK